MPTKEAKDFIVVETKDLTPDYTLLTLTPADGKPLLPVLPGQFIQVKSPHSATLLRRPISICDVDEERNELLILVRRVGDATQAICDTRRDEKLNVIMPLGNGFPITDSKSDVLLAGGGVGVAPLLLLGRRLRQAGARPRFLIGARSADHVLLVDELALLGPVDITTDDGSLGYHGLITEHPLWNDPIFNHIYTCGPLPMMKAVAAKARELGADCHASLENMMACGLGACLCCVEKTVKGNQCVCTDGPVFDINQLLW